MNNGVLLVSLVVYSVVFGDDFGHVVFLLPIVECGRADHGHILGIPRIGVVEYGQEDNEKHKYRTISICSHPEWSCKWTKAQSLGNLSR